MYKPGKAEVSSDVFRLQMATLLHDEAQLFGPTKLDQPQRVKLLCDKAMAAIKAVPASKQTKELTTKIQATLKKSRVS
jgi:phosphoribosyl-dephospho-CoA transferase